MLYCITPKTTNGTLQLLKITLETGRHHQIRAQLAAIGCPIKGDLKIRCPTFQQRC